jgi:hypothetical protein
VGGKWKEVYDARRRGESSGMDLMEAVMTGPNEKVAFSERGMRKTRAWFLTWKVREIVAGQ